MEGKLEKLKSLKELLDAGVLTQEEFTTQKKLVLEENNTPAIQPAQAVPQGMPLQAQMQMQPGMQIQPNMQMQPGMMQPGIMSRPPPPELVDAVRKMGCTSTVLMIFCIFGIGNPFVSIPGLMAACPFGCNSNPSIHLNRELLMRSVEQVKCAANTTAVFAIIGCIGCIGGAISVFASPCLIIWFTPTWGCYTFFAIVWLAYAGGNLVPVITSAAILSQQANAVMTLVARNGAIAV